LLGSGVLLGACLLWLGPLCAQEPAISPESLRGLQGVGIRVRLLQPLLEKDGVEPGALYEAVARRLREARIEVLDLPETELGKASFLEVIVAGVNDPQNAAYVIDLGFKLRRVQLVDRDRSAATASGWERRWSGIIPVYRLREVHEHLTNFTAEFASAYLAVNPPPKPAAGKE